MRPDGSSTISVLGGETMPAELAHELMGIQVNSNFQLENTFSVKVLFIPSLIGIGVPLYCSYI